MDNINGYKESKIILNNELFIITLYDTIDENKVENILYVYVKNDFMSKINNFTLINNYNEEFIKALENIYNAFDKLNNKISIIYDISKLTNVFPPTILWKIGKFFSKKKTITNKILYCTCVITSSESVNNLIQTFINIYDNIKPINLCTSKSVSLEFIKLEIIKYNNIINEL